MSLCDFSHWGKFKSNTQNCKNEPDMKISTFRIDWANDRPLAAHGMGTWQQVNISDLDYQCSS